MVVTMVVHIQVHVEDRIDPKSLCIELPDEGVVITDLEGNEVGFFSEYETVDVLTNE